MDMDKDLARPASRRATVWLRFEINDADIYAFKFR